MPGSRRLASLAAAGAIACGGLVLPACGGDDDGGEKKAKGTDLTALRCPLVPTADGKGFEPAKRSFDTAELLRKRFDEASRMAARFGCNLVVSRKDGKSIPVPVDVDPKRIYVYTENGVVTEIEGVGGGI